MNVKIAPSEVYDNLKEQMTYLKTSILNSYSGQYHEAKRIAGNIRFMAHDNPDRSLIAKSRESFGLEEEIIFIDFEDISQRKNFFEKTTLFSSTQVMPLFDPRSDLKKFQHRFPKLVTQTQWLENIVFKRQKEWSRNDIIRYLRNDAGGQHLDEYFNELQYFDRKFSAYKHGEHKISVLDISVYESGITLWQSVMRYMQYASAYTHGKPVPKPYKH